MPKKYGDIFGLHLGYLPTVVLTKYEDIKYVLSLDETAHRPDQGPFHKTRPGWEGPIEVDGELNDCRTSGIVGVNVSYFNPSFALVPCQKIIC